MLWLGYRRVWGTDGRTNNDQTKDVVPLFACLANEFPQKPQNSCAATFHCKLIKIFFFAFKGEGGLDSILSATRR